MEERYHPAGWLPSWALYSVLLLGPFGLLPIALSKRYHRSTRLIVALPILLSIVPVAVLAFLLLRPIL